ncbi:response regulator transcription factor [Pseudarthrobacter sp902506025]|uniref:DNA-binding NarL/FixJ family response regulator n=1 Tax=Pseudarthrobacter defluvii TaxID=410837 RepID=A0ABT9UJY1_9MICC|nr:response regulator transcription factor [Pseudarthrobacter defluvii]MDQ0118724.1 DNA-binding NarL/FixJ family response regulator [Pseudarthrobacter defluvii]
MTGEELVGRGLRGLLLANGFKVAGESGSVRQAARRIPALRPDLAIIDDDLPDGSGVGLCRTIAAADANIRCVLMTGETDESVLIGAILAGAWGCLSQQDDNEEQLRLIRRAMHGYTAYSRRFQTGILAPIQADGTNGPDGRLGMLSKQEMKVAAGVARGLTNGQIGQEMFLAEKTVKNMVSSVLMKFDMARRTEVAVFVSGALKHTGDLAQEYRSSRDTDLIAEVTAALVVCTSEAGSVPLSNRMLLLDAMRLADALAVTRTRPHLARHLQEPGMKFEGPEPRKPGPVNPRGTDGVLGPGRR